MQRYVHVLRVRLEAHAAARIEVDYPAHEHMAVDTEERVCLLGATEVQQRARLPWPAPEVQRRDHDLPGARAHRRSDDRGEVCPNEWVGMGDRCDVALKVQGALAAGPRKDAGQ